MASVTLDTVWLHDAVDPATYITLPAASIDDITESPGEVRTYAQGRQRMIVRAGQKRAIQVGLTFMDRATVDQLRAWTGALLMLRDPRGRLIFGTFWTLPLTEFVASDLATGSFTFQEVTFSIEV